MKRIGNLWEQICSLDNLRKAAIIAQQGKSGQYGVKIFNQNFEANLLELRDWLLQKEFMTSAYSYFTLWDPKERLISRLPFFPDRIVHHAIMNILEKYFMACFTADTYSCMKGRGIHLALEKLKIALRDHHGTTYGLEMDVRKFYKSIDHDVLKQLLRRKFKDPDLLWLLDEIIDSSPGIPIGNYLSQYFGNFYLSQLDHRIKEQWKAHYYFRYTDNMILLSGSKPFLHDIRARVQSYLHENLKLELKGNYRVFHVDKCGIPFVGYEAYHDHILMRKSIKQSFARAVASNKPPQVLSAYWGWAKWCNSNHLMKKLFDNQETKAA